MWICVGSHHRANVYMSAYAKIRTGRVYHGNRYITMQGSLISSLNHLHIITYNDPLINTPPPPLKKKTYCHNRHHRIQHLFNNNQYYVIACAMSSTVSRYICDQNSGILIKYTNIYVQLCKKFVQLLTPKHNKCTRKYAWGISQMLSMRYSYQYGDPYVFLIVKMMVTSPSVSMPPDILPSTVQAEFI